jgi:glutathione S-transferase
VAVTVPVLWHIEVSHYNEKARWALELKRVSHRRRAPLPGFVHPFVALAKTGRPTFPILELDGRAIGDSSAIIEELERRVPDPPLYPADPAERRRALELEEFFDEEVAPDVRRLLFYEISLDREVSAAAMTTLAAPAAVRRGGRGVLRVFARRYGGGAAQMDAARERVRRGLERVEAEVQPSGYLVGESFSVADLTAAAVLMHLARPPEFGYTFPPYPPAVEDFVASLPPAPLDWVRRIWREHRPASHGS